MKLDAEQIRDKMSMTKYPKLFSCYWGYGTYTDDQKLIIDNRNEFVELFNITKGNTDLPDYIKYQLYPKHLLIPNSFYTWKRQKLIAEFKKKNNITHLDFMDHFETYQSDDYYIGLISPYYPYDEDIKTANNLGYELYDKELYAGAISFVKKIPKSIKYKDTNTIYRNI
tara:strand:+ start:36 stop:542 length:507 start_codon:yes stop_codon:yes gene_type:complete